MLSLRRLPILRTLRPRHAAVVLAALACARQPAQPLLEAPPPAAATPRATPPADERGFIAVVVAGDATDLAPKVAARVEAVFVAPGAQVKAGAPIARVDVASARHELAAAAAGLREAQLRFERRRRLSSAGTGAVTAEELDGARRDHLQARARVAELQTAVAEAVLTAPASGTIVERYLSAGALAGPDRPIARLVSAGEPRVRFAVPEERAAAVAPGQPVQVKIPPLSLTLAGRIAGLSPEIDAASRMVYGVATLDDLAHARQLTTGLIARVLLPGGQPVPGEGRPAPFAPPIPVSGAPAPASPEPVIAPATAAPASAAPAPARPARKRPPAPSKAPALPKW